MIVLLNANYKGGVGKTTTNVMMAYQLAERGYKTLFLDFDSQMSGTQFLTQLHTAQDIFLSGNIVNAIKQDDLKANIINLRENLDYVPGNEMINLFDELMSIKKINKNTKHLYFRSLLLPLYKKEEYDFVIMDVSPSKTSLNTAVMATANTHVVISQTEVLSVQQIGKYIADIKGLQQNNSIQSNLLGISLGMFDRTNLSKQIVAKVKQRYPSLVFQTIIKRRSKVKTYAATGYPSKNRSGMYNKVHHNAIYMYTMLTDEILVRLGLPAKKVV